MYLCWFINFLLRIKKIWGSLPNIGLQKYLLINCMAGKMLWFKGLALIYVWGNLRNKDNKDSTQELDAYFWKVIAYVLICIVIHGSDVWHTVHYFTEVLLCVLITVLVCAHIAFSVFYRVCRSRDLINMLLSKAKLCYV